MERCELLDGCLFFNYHMKNMPTASEMMKKMYCLWHYEQCARYKVASVLGRKKIPADLFPYETLRAKTLLKKYM